MSRLQPHAPLAGSDVRGHERRLVERVSTHAPLAGNDLTSGQTKSCGCGFQPTLPLRGATADEFGVRILAVFQPTLPLRGATSSASSLPNSTGSFQPTLPLRGATHEHGPGGQPQPASTHAPLAGSDVPRVELFRDLRVSTHAPLAGSDMPITSAAQPSPFCFNPRSPCGERPDELQRCGLVGQVSTHAPLAGSDMKLGDTPSLFLAFQPTLPLRGATFLTAIRNAPSRSFNPRSPCGERQLKTSCASSTTSFNPRSPCGERRCTRCPVGCRRPCFNPRSPCGERPMW